MPRPRSWTDEQLTAAVAASSTLSEVHRRLGLRAGKYDVMRAHIARLGLDASHIPRAVVGDTRRSRRWTDEELRAAVAEAQSMHDVIRRLGYIPNGGLFRFVSAHTKLLGLDTSHFSNGQGWAKGRKFPDRSVRSLDQVLAGARPSAPEVGCDSGSSAPG